MIVRPNANDTAPVYIATREEIEEIKRKYIWWYKMDASITESIIVYLKTPRDR